MKKSFMAILAAIVVSAAGCGAQSASESDGKTTGQTDEIKMEMVILSTEFGDMKIMLYNETPLHKENFLNLVDEGYYDGLIFHRIINNFMIQGGDPKSRTADDGSALGTGGPEYTLPAEINPALCHKKGALAAARLGDTANPKKESSGSQFYIVDGTTVSTNQLAGIEQRSGIKYTEEQVNAYTTVGGTPHLDHAYTVFGEVVEGLDVIDKIASVPTDQRDRPLDNVTMTIKRVKE